MNKNSGVYALYWWDQDLVYIGLSQNLTARKAEHYNLMRKNNHTNYKIQNAYHNYGKPEFIVLEYCRISELPKKEIEWCNEFNALGPRGLCLVEPGIVGFGTNSNASKYTKWQVLKIFSYLYKGELTIKNIATKLNINRSLITDIVNGSTHIWLKELYPEKYEKMRSIDRRKLFNSQKPLLALIKSPSDAIIEVYSVVDFYKKELPNISTYSHIYSVISGKIKSYNGYTLIKRY